MRVFVGLSGGVDSATSAAILKERGYDVTGVFIKIWQPEFIECTWREDRLDAMRAAAHLDIQFQEIDLSDAYKRDVVDRMIAEYSAGSTPNPDVLCNEKIKFGAFYRWAMSEGADYVATGHYARSSTDGRDCRLLRALDANKDQSYFLHRITKDQLARTLFPVGGMLKKDVRERARSFRLPIAEKADSQGLCFVGEVAMHDFLVRYIKVEKGPVLNRAGQEIGMHHGAALYTIGQRHGFTVRESGLPMYVTKINTSRNTITVSASRDDAAVTSAAVSDMHWIGYTSSLPLSCAAQTRYREATVDVVIRNTNGGLRVEFTQPHVVSPGQAIVLYDRDTCIGGGIIRLN